MSAPRRLAAGLWALVAALVLSAAALAAEGDLDRSFGGGDGKVRTSFGPGAGDSGHAIAIDRAGRIVVAGYTFKGGNYDFALTRYRPNGTLDPSFSGDGRARTAFGTSNDFANSIALTPAGRIVVAGSSVNATGEDFALARYLPNGALDPSFGGDGKVSTDFGGNNDDASSIALTPAGRIVAGGGSFNATGEDFALARYRPNGTLDRSFGGDGKVRTDFGGPGDDASAVALMPSGRVIAAGAALGASGYDFALARYLPSGALDSSFSGDGRLLTDFGSSIDLANSTALDARGRIVVAGSRTLGLYADFALARYLPNGALDPSFSGDGRQTTATGSGDDVAWAVELEPRGRIIAGGNSSNGVGADQDFALVRYRSDGTLDSSFSGDGMLLTDFGSSDDGANDLALDARGRIVAAGYSFSSGHGDFALARYIGERTRSGACANTQRGSVGRDVLNRHPLRRPAARQRRPRHPARPPRQRLPERRCRGRPRLRRARQRQADRRRRARSAGGRSRCRQALGKRRRRSPLRRPGARSARRRPRPRRPAGRPRPGPDPRPRRAP